MALTPNLPEDEQQDRRQDVGDQAKVYAARVRLQKAIDQADALDAIREIAGNLIGSEEIAVFKVDQKRSEMWLYWSFGIDPNKHSILEAQSEPNLKRVLRGEAVFRFRLTKQNLLSTDDPVNALVPIVVNGNVCAVIVLFRLFPHKVGMEDVDREICQVLAHCSGRAIEPYHSR